MDQVSAGKATRDGARTRRRRMRDKARAQHTATSPVPDRYQTPEWLERSFVLPLTRPEASDVPSQTVPHHDDDPEPTGEPRVIDHLEADALSAAPVAVPSFVRPPSDDIDFARVIRRADLCRKALRLAWTCGGLAGLALIAYLLTASTLVLGTALGLAFTATVALALRLRLNSAPVPRLQR